jgi:hypothetical protein
MLNRRSRHAIPSDPTLGERAGFANTRAIITPEHRKGLGGDRRRRSARGRPRWVWWVFKPRPMRRGDVPPGRSDDRAAAEGCPRRVRKAPILMGRPGAWGPARATIHKHTTGRAPGMPLGAAGPDGRPSGVGTAGRPLDTFRGLSKGATANPGSAAARGEAPSALTHPAADFARHLDPCWDRASREGSAAPFERHGGAGHHGPESRHEARQIEGMRIAGKSSEPSTRFGRGTAAESPPTPGSGHSVPRGAHDGRCCPVAPSGLVRLSHPPRRTETASRR